MCYGNKKVLLHIKENISVHRQKYLDWAAVEFYWLLEKIYETKELQMSLRKEYGVTEVEAINILNHKEQILKIILSNINVCSVVMKIKNIC